MIINSPDKAVLRVLWEEVAHNGRFDAVSFARWAEKVHHVEDLGVAIYGAKGDLHAIRSAVQRDAEYLASLGFLEVHSDSAELTLFGRFFAESLEYPDWALLMLENQRQGNGASRTV